MALDVGTARRYRQHIRQHDGQPLQHQRITGGPQIDVTAISQGNAVKETKAVFTGLKFDLGFTYLGDDGDVFPLPQLGFFFYF